MPQEQHEQIEMIQISSRQAKEKVEFMEALARLEKNKDFKKLFKDYYLSHYAVRLVELKAAPHMQADGDQKFVTGALDAIGHVGQFLRYVQQEGVAAQSLIDSNERELELLEEEVA